MQRVRALATRAAGASATVLITGESGVGKEEVARALHEASQRAAGPFVVVDCAALPDQLLEAELFGFQAGAFTGAVQARAGRFEQAQNGTLLLDEVASLSPRQQAKLLRVVQDRTIRRLGGGSSLAVDLRIVATSNRDLRRAVDEGWFRADLLYRLRVVQIEVPPLRERKDDLLPLAEHFLRGAEAPPRLRRVSTAAAEVMQAYSWPGNVRELQNVIQRAAILADPEDGDALLVRHLSAEISRMAEGLCAVEGEPSLDLAAAMRRVRFCYLREALREARGNRSEAARLLGISRRGLYDLLREFPDAPVSPGFPRV